MRVLRGLLVVALLLVMPIAILADTYELLAGNPKTGIKDAGEVVVSNDGVNLYVSYLLDFPPYVLDEMHLEITEVGPGQIPQKKGNPIPGQFAYSNGPDFVIPLIGTHPKTGEDYDWESGDVLYIAAHGKICKDVDSIIAAIDNFPEKVKMVVRLLPPGVPPVYALEVTISEDGFLNGTYSAYCIDPDLTISQQHDYMVDVSTNDMPNMDLVNYVINKDYVGKPCYDAGGNYLGDYTNSDIQGAIWALFFPLQSFGDINPPPDPARVNVIVLDAEANGEGYEPGCGDYLAVKLIPREGLQRILIKFPIECDCQTVWAAIVRGNNYMYEFPGKNWALYVEYEVNGTPAPPKMSSSVTTTWGSIKNR